MTYLGDVFAHTPSRVASDGWLWAPDIQYFDGKYFLSLPISWTSVVCSFVVSTLIGVFFGFVPARRASMLTAIDALRFES